MNLIEQHIKVACAGWTIAKEHSSLFPAEGSHLERYATLFDAVEVNSTFYRLPKADTFLKWKEAVPASFRFAVKLSKEITHVGRLRQLEGLPLFVERARLLEEKLGPILVQLPPSLAFEEAVASAFFETCRHLWAGNWALEPRHATWFTPAATDLLEFHRIALVAADPAVNPAGTVPGAWDGLYYFRLHGSPEMYHSNYSENYLRELAGSITAAGVRSTWVVFDNTASGAAVGNGRFLKGLVEQI